MDKVNLILYIIIGVLVLVSAVLTVIAGFLKKSKNKTLKECGEKLEAVNNTITDTLSKAVSGSKLLNTIILNAMKQAEENVNFNGEDKKKWALMTIKEEANNAGINYTNDELLEAIEEYITFSKSVNSRTPKIEKSEVEANE